MLIKEPTRPSKVSVCFNRLGIVLCFPLLLLAAARGIKELVEPSGRLIAKIPTGAVAWEPSRLSSDDRRIADLLISEQTAMAIYAPTGFIVVGVPLGTIRQNNLEWTKFQLRDGREIGVAATEKKSVSDSAIEFLWDEKARGHVFTDKDEMSFDGVRVAFLNSFDQFPPSVSPWPQERQREWMWSLIAAASGLAVYLVVRSVGC